MALGFFPPRSLRGLYVRDDLKKKFPCFSGLVEMEPLTVLCRGRGGHLCSKGVEWILFFVLVNRFGSGRKKDEGGPGTSRLTEVNIIPKTPRATDEDCVCGSGKTYGDCCRAFHFGEKQVQSPTELIRARFSAYASGCVGKQEEGEREREKTRYVFCLYVARINVGASDTSFTPASISL